MTTRPLIRALAAAGIGASIYVSSVANAIVEFDPFPSIVESVTLPATMEEWIATNGTEHSWNPVNARLGTHADRPDGVIYIFPDAAAAETWWPEASILANDPPPPGVPDDAVAYVHWALDNDSGEFPGIMAKTDDFDFKTNNCIMASGNTIPELSAPKNAKTCSNPQGTAKRFKLVVLKADTPIDLVFNTTATKPLVFDQDDSLGLTCIDGDPNNVCDDPFRTYRFIMKWGNGTGTDSETEVREGTRLVGFKVELGYGVGDGADPTNFVASAPDDGLSYETRTEIEPRYFNKKDDGLNVEVWLENEFATISPSMYSLVGDDRAPLGGFWDKEPAGIFPPQTITSEDMLDSGINRTTANYFDVAATQGAASGVDFPENMFGYLMYYGIFEEGDPGNLSGGIYIDEDGDPATEGSIYAWWDGSSPTCCYRWGIDGSNFDGVEGPDAFGLVSEEKLAEIASRPLDENQVLGPPRYEVAYTDDLGGLNSDTFIKIGEAYDPVANPTFTVRFTAQSTGPNGANLADTDPGVPDGPWTLAGNPPLELADFPEAPVDPVDPVDPTPPPTDDNDSGFCAYNPNNRAFDPVLPGLLLAGLAYLGWKLRKKSAK